MKLIVGLGNPGSEYVGTRHNFGFMAVDYLAEKYGSNWQSKSRFSASLAETEIMGEKILLVKPLTYYNLVGEAVQKIRAFYRLDLADIVVIHDDMALPLGTIRTRIGGSDAGNNGIKNIINTVGFDFARVRMGSGLKPTVNGDTQPGSNRRGYVLGKLNQAERQQLDDQLSTIQQIVANFAKGSFAETTYR